MHNHQSGSIIGIVALISAATAVLILGLARLNRNTTSTGVYLNTLNRSFGTARSGLNIALGKLVLNPNIVPKGSLATVTDLEVYISSERARFTNSYTRRTFRAKNGSIINDAFYIVTSATATIGLNRQFSTRLHTYANVSNTGNYFAAIKDKLDIGEGVDLDGATIYGKDLNFADNASPATKLLRAEYSGTVTPPKPWTVGFKTDGVEITEPASAGEPVGPGSQLLFPQILDSDITRYQQLAHTATPFLAGHVKCDWRPGTPEYTGHIFPPGYNEVLSRANDLYGGRTLNNLDHVYYCNENMFVEGIVHGQILFVTTNTINITGNLTSVDLDAYNGGNGINYPGFGSTAAYESSSTAHQAVLIAKTNIRINLMPSPAAGSLLVIQAMMFAADGKLIANTYPDRTLADYLTLRFELTGSMILSAMPDAVRDVFQASRLYRYMNTLRTNPPPYIPALVQIYYSLEEMVSTPGLN